MRNLTIKRNKTFVASLMKLKVYIEDPIANELTINKIPCRKLGELKNGEEKTFVTDEKPAKLFVIADTLSKDYCNDLYPIPEGDSDIYLSGKNRFNLKNGNAFRFDVLPNYETIQNRQKGNKKGLFILIPCIIIGLVLGYIIGTNLF